MNKTFSRAFWVGSAFVFGASALAGCGSQDGLDDRSEVYRYDGPAIYGQEETWDQENQIPEDIRFEDPYGEEYYGGNLDTIGGVLRGTMGSVGFDHPVTSLEGWEYDGYADLTGIVSNAEGGAVMAILSFNGGLDHEAFEPGSTVSGGGYNYDEGSVSLIGCSGDETYNWEFDQDADDVEVTIEKDPENDEVTSIRFEATFEDGSLDGQTVFGEFQLRR